MDLVAKGVGLIVVFYICKAGLGQAKEGDLTKFFILLGIFLSLSFRHLAFK